MLKKSLTGKARAAAKAVRVKQEADERAAAQDRRELARMARAAAATRRQRLKEQLEQHVDTQQISQQGDVTDNYVWHLDTPLYLFERQGRTYRVLNELRLRLNHLLKSVEGGRRYVRLIIGRSDLAAHAEGDAISTSFQSSPARALKKLDEHLEAVEMQYDLDQRDGAFVAD